MGVELSATGKAEGAAEGLGEAQKALGRESESALEASSQAERAAEHEGLEVGTSAEKTEVENAATSGTGRPAKPSFQLGASDGGPGHWDKPKTWRGGKGAEYQLEHTGNTSSLEYQVSRGDGSGGSIDFDHYDPARNVLVDSKEWRNWPVKKPDPLQKIGINKLLKQARGQVEAARGTLIEWWMPPESVAKIRAILIDGKITGIEVVAR